MSAGRHTVWHPRVADVTVAGGPREIVVRLAQGIEVELWPGAVDHGEQVAWIDAVTAHLLVARRMMVEHHDQGTRPVTR